MRPELERVSGETSAPAGLSSPNDAALRRRKAAMAVPVSSPADAALRRRKAARDGGSDEPSGYFFNAPVDAGDAEPDAPPMPSPRKRASMERAERLAREISGGEDDGSPLRRKAPLAVGLVLAGVLLGLWYMGKR